MHLKFRREILHSEIKRDKFHYDAFMQPPPTGSGVSVPDSVNNSFDAPRSHSGVFARSHSAWDLTAPGDVAAVEAISAGLGATGGFYTGTLIATPHGAAPVEALRQGSLVTTQSGAQPVLWVGHKNISPRFADPLRDLPVRIAAGALGGGLPQRDLLLAPGHALLLGGMLVPARTLVNGRSIRQEAALPESFTYYHLELAGHDLLTAEGVCAESFVDIAGQGFFHNWTERAPSQPVEELPFPRARTRRDVPTALREKLGLA